MSGKKPSKRAESKEETAVESPKRKRKATAAPPADSSWDDIAQPKAAKKTKSSGAKCPVTTALTLLQDGPKNLEELAQAGGVTPMQLRQKLAETGKAKEAPCMHNASAKERLWSLK